MILQLDRRKLMTKPIVRYAAGWHSARNQGRIKTWFSPTDAHTWNYDNPAEFAAVLMMLQGDDDPFVTESGAIATGPEDPGFD